jgi:hypothetical protein
MAAKLVNVRLDEERLRKAKVLRESGVALSDLVREAIDARFDSLRAGLTPADAPAILDRILERYSEPAGVPTRGYDVHDSRSARAAIAKKLKARRS